jgi:molybdopterin molybdotransferase
VPLREPVSDPFAATIIYSYRNTYNTDIDLSILIREINYICLIVLSDTMEHDHDGMVQRERAVTHMLNARHTALASQPTEMVTLGDGIDGRVLATGIDAVGDVPVVDHATMDGYAVNTRDEYPLDIVDSDVFPEDEPPPLDPGQAIHIATGAPLPDRANAVLKQEAATVTDGHLSGPPLDCGTFHLRARE